MVFRVRDKNIFWTRNGWKNNYYPRVFNMPRPINGDATMTIRCRYDHHSFLRMVQSYRNISRVCKQYFYGDKQVEQIFLLELRSLFKIPFTCETPVHLLKYGGERRMADQLDRDYELCTYNQHPLQLFVYKLHNRYLQQVNQQIEDNENGVKSEWKQAEKQLFKIIDQTQKTLPLGESLSDEKALELIFNMARKVRDQTERPNKTSTGEFNDYVEARRPFMEAHPTRLSN